MATGKQTEKSWEIPTVSGPQEKCHSQPVDWVIQVSSLGTLLLMLAVAQQTRAAEPMLF